MSKGTNRRGLGRMMGLGACPSSNVAESINAFEQCGFTQVPVIEYVTWTVDLPVPTAAVTTTFGNQIQILQDTSPVPGVTSVDSSFVMNGLLQVDMLVIGFGIHGFAEPQQGSQIGNYINFIPAAGQVPVSPDALVVDANNGAGTGHVPGGDLTFLSGSLTGGSTMSPAILEWGIDAQNALWHLMNGYQFQWIVQQRHQLVKEMCSDIAYFGSYAEATAAGSSQEAFQRLVNRANNHYTSLADPGVFLPINATRTGSVVTAGVSTKYTPVLHPTRAYDTLDVTWGGLRAQGMSGMVQPFRKLPKPVLLEKGLPCGMILFAQDQYHQALMQQYLSQNDQISGTHTTMPIGSAVSGTTVSPAASPIFPELSLDATPVLSFLTVLTDRVLLKGGALQLAILIKGFEVWGPWKAFVTQQLVTRGLAGVPSDYSAHGASTLG